ncbi:MAG: UDP-glucose 4-epimerase GalE [Planctomycetota bacterium]
MAVLVTGGAGYIGSVTVEMLLARGEHVVVLDNFSRGHREAVSPGAILVQGNAGDRTLVSRVVAAEKIGEVVHFAAFACVGESVEKPALYFDNNVTQAAALFETLAASGVRRVVFSSSCAVYGEPEAVPIPEDHPRRPASPYGWTKYLCEEILRGLDAAGVLRFMALRYFNASGAAGRLGEHHAPETHLIPNVLAAAAGRFPALCVFGSDYPTPDGTAVRDYIHVSDLARAHVLALDALRAGKASDFLNLGTGQGHSVLEIVAAAKRVAVREISLRMEGRRPGDPARLVAKAGRARDVLGWAPEHTDIEAVVRSAWEWHEGHPEGYK